MHNKMKRTKKTGLPPGSLIYTGFLREVPTQIEFISYHAEQYSKRTVNVKEVAETKNGQMNWVKVTGLADPSIIETIGKQLDLSHLLLEDILNTNQRPTFSEYNKALFISMKVLHPTEGKPEFRQVSFVITSTLLISFSEEDHWIFRIVEERLSKKVGKIRQRSIDYLLHAFLDMAVDQYSEYIDTISEELEIYDEKILNNPSESLLIEIQQLRKQLVEIERLVSPLREVVNQLITLNEGIIVNTSHTYFRDLYDHLLSLLDSIRANIEITSSLKDFYISRVSLNMNKVIQLLTIVSVIFIPLTFLAGVYGMNFKHMPELEWHYGYYIILTIMLLVFIGMLFYFKRKKWL